MVIEDKKEVTDAPEATPEMPGSIGDLADILENELGQDETTTEADESDVATQVEEDSDQEESEDTSQPVEAEETEDPEWFQKRIDKFTRKLRESEEVNATLQEKIQKLEEKIAKGESPKPQHSQALPSDVAILETPEQIEQARDLHENRLDWAEDQLDSLKHSPDSVARELKAQGVNLTDADGDEDYSEANMRKFIRNVQRHASSSIRKWIPKREKQLEEQLSFNKEAHQKYPWLDDKSSSEYKVFSQELDQNPGFKQNPQYKLLLARYVRGLMAEQRDKGQKKSELSDKPRRSSASSQPGKPVVSKSKTSPQKAPDERASEKISSARDELIQKGDRDSLSNLLENFVNI